MARKLGEGFESCPTKRAQVDSNHHGEISPQGPQPDTGGVDGFGGVQIFHFAGFRGHIGRVWKGGCSQSVLTGTGAEDGQP
jgi:hypothetical protein